jgi:hypothetical protein
VAGWQPASSRQTICNPATILTVYLMKDVLWLGWTMPMAKFRYKKICVYAVLLYDAAKSGHVVAWRKEYHCTQSCSTIVRITLSCISQVEQPWVICKYK